MRSRQQGGGKVSWFKIGNLAGSLYSGLGKSKPQLPPLDSPSSSSEACSGFSHLARSLRTAWRRTSMLTARLTTQVVAASAQAAAMK